MIVSKIVIVAGEFSCSSSSTSSSACPAVGMYEFHSRDSICVVTSDHFFPNHVDESIISVISGEICDASFEVKDLLLTLIFLVEKTTFPYFFLEDVYQKLDLSSWGA